MPEYNPDSVKITCPLECARHGWTVGAVYNTIPRFKKIEGARDANGLTIYVMSLNWNEPVWLGSTDYQLTETN